MNVCRIFICEIAFSIWEYAQFEDDFEDALSFIFSLSQLPTLITAEWVVTKTSEALEPVRIALIWSLMIN